jgi:hypothetical protein
MHLLSLGKAGCFSLPLALALQLLQQAVLVALWVGVQVGLPAAVV